MAVLWAFYRNWTLYSTFFKSVRHLCLIYGEKIKITMQCNFCQMRKKVFVWLFMWFDWTQGDAKFAFRMIRLIKKWCQSQKCFLKLQNPIFQNQSLGTGSKLEDFLIFYHFYPIYLRKTIYWMFSFTLRKSKLPCDVISVKWERKFLFNSSCGLIEPKGTQNSYSRWSVWSKNHVKVKIALLIFQNAIFWKSVSS